MSRLKLEGGFYECNLELADHELKNGKILVDGNSLTWKLSSFELREMGESFFVEDISRCTKYVRNLFKLLADCNVQVILVIQGGLRDPNGEGDSSTEDENDGKVVHGIPMNLATTDIRLPLSLSKIIRSVARSMKLKVLDCGRHIYLRVNEFASKFDSPILTDDGGFFSQVPWAGMIPLDSMEAAASNGAVECKIFKPSASIEAIRLIGSEVLTAVSQTKSMMDGKTFFPGDMFRLITMSNDIGLGIISALSKTRPPTDAAQRRVVKQINDKLSFINYPRNFKRIPTCEWDERKLAGLLSHLCGLHYMEAIASILNLVDHSDRELVAHILEEGVTDMMNRVPEPTLPTAVIGLCISARK